MDGVSEGAVNETTREEGVERSSRERERERYCKI